MSFNNLLPKIPAVSVSKVVSVSKSIEILTLQEKSIGIGIELKKAVSHTPGFTVVV